MMKNLTQQILEFGQVKRGLLGVQGSEITSELAEALGYASNKGAFVSQVVPESAADEAGLEAGDVIVSLNGKSISTFGELRAKIATLGAGKEITIGVIRDGKNKTFDATLQEAGDNKTRADKLHGGLARAELSNTDNSDPLSGVKVTSVEKGSPADAYQLKEGDIIIGVNRTRVKNLGQFRAILEDKPNVLALNIQRGERTIYLVVR